MQRIRLFKTTMALGVACLILWMPSISLGWGAGGHMIVAKVAFDRLSPHAKTEVAKLLAINVKVKLADGTQPKLSAKSKASVAAAKAKSQDFGNAAHWLGDPTSAQELYGKKNPQ